MILTPNFLCLHLAFPTWLLGKFNLCAAWGWFCYNIFTEFLFFSAIFLLVVMISVFGGFSLFVFYFVFPQGCESFWKCLVICFVHLISSHACTVYLASFNSPSKCCFLLIITSTSFIQFIVWWLRLGSLSVLFIVMFQMHRRVPDTYYVFSKYMLKPLIKVNLSFLL